MLCEKCKKNNATTHIKSVINGKVTEKYLCDECAASEGLVSQNSATLSDFLSSIFNDNFGIGDYNKPVTRCEVCGSSLSDITKSGRLGCSRCYETFKTELLPYLKRVHGSTKHTGKSIEQTETAEKPASKESELKSLKEELSSLVKAEKFEEAAVVRDKIKAMEGKV